MDAAPVRFHFPRPPPIIALPVCPAPSPPRPLAPRCPLPVSPAPPPAASTFARQPCGPGTLALALRASAFPGCPGGLPGLPGRSGIAQPIVARPGGPGTRLLSRAGGSPASFPRLTHARIRCARIQCEVALPRVETMHKGCVPAREFDSLWQFSRPQPGAPIIPTWRPARALRLTIRRDHP